MWHRTEHNFYFWLNFGLVRTISPCSAARLVAASRSVRSLSASLTLRMHQCMTVYKHGLGSQSYSASTSGPPPLL